jgi:hypothetical protein
VSNGEKEAIEIVVKLKFPAIYIGTAEFHKHMEGHPVRDVGEPGDGGPGNEEEEGHDLSYDNWNFFHYDATKRAQVQNLQLCQDMVSKKFPEQVKRKVSVPTISIVS